MSHLESLGEELRAQTEEKHRLREQALPRCRQVIRQAALAIRAAHRAAYDQAASYLALAKAALEEVQALLQAHPDLFFAGYVEDAQKEYAEACLTVAVLRGEPLPSPQELRVTIPAYLNGLGEAVGELRRRVLDLLRQDRLEGCWETLTVMEEIYGLLASFDYPDALTGGLRRTTDMVRGVLERTRGDLTMALRQQQLEQRLAALAQRLSAYQPVPKEGRPETGDGEEGIPSG